MRSWTEPSLEERRDAELYARLHRGHPGDVEHYRDLVRGARSVLELGCGDARILARLAAPDRRLFGLDSHAGMLQRAQRALAEVDSPWRLVHADMKAPPLDACFERILVPYNGLLCLTEERELRDCLAWARQHLLAGGLLGLDVYRPPRLTPGERRAIERSEDRPKLVARIRDDAGRPVEVYEHDSWWPETQRVDAVYRFDVHHGEEVTSTSQTIRQRYLYEEQLVAQLADCGFDIESVRGGFRGEPSDDDAELIVVVAAPRASGTAA
jgi:SAM-dependent methyltransferase